jgi:hypothetical protein
MNISHWSFDHFCTYILLCLASSDHDLDEKELQTIRDFLNEQEIKKPEVLIKELLVVIKYQTADERTIFIEKNIPTFVHNPEDAKSLMDVIEELIISDFTIDPDEMNLYRMIKKNVREIS